jgi:hypothetical protein
MRSGPAGLSVILKSRMQSKPPLGALRVLARGRSVGAECSRSIAGLRPRLKRGPRQLLDLVGLPNSERVVPFLLPERPR